MVLMALETGTCCRSRHRADVPRSIYSSKVLELDGTVRLWLIVSITSLRMSGGRSDAVRSGSGCTSSSSMSLYIIRPELIHKWLGLELVDVYKRSRGVVFLDNMLGNVLDEGL